MILPAGATSYDTGYYLPPLYGVGYGYGMRVVPRQVSQVNAASRAEVRDMVTLSPAAQRIIDQAARLEKLNIGKE